MSNCLLGVILSFLIFGLSAICIHFGYYAVSIVFIGIFLGYFLGAILDTLENINLQLFRIRKNDQAKKPL